MAVPFIYVMKGLKKVVPPSRIILEDIWLSFYPTAKIGVLGANGAGKSSLLRIMAGVDQDFQGEAWAHKGTRVGFLPQEPKLDESLDVRGNVELAVAFAKRMTQPDILKMFADLAVHIPADTSVTSTDPLAALFAAAVESGMPRPQVPQLGAFWGNFGDALNHVIDEGTDPQQAVTDACAAMNTANSL